MDIKVDEVYTLKGKGDLRFSIYEKRTTKDRVVVEKGKRVRVPLEEGEVGVTQDEMVASNLTLEECIRRLIGFKIKKNEGIVSLERFLEVYIEEKNKFEEAINKIINVKV